MQNITYIRNAQLVLERGILWDGAMILADGKIQAFGKERVYCFYRPQTCINTRTVGQ